jgi:hypothetical protein
LEEIIQENRLVQQGMREANYTIDATADKIKENLLKADKVDMQLKKGEADLA